MRRGAVLRGAARCCAVLRGARRCVTGAHLAGVRLVLYVPHDVAALDAVLGGLEKLEQYEE